MSSSLPQVALEQGRAFIPLAVNGCGVGCKYCYIDQPGERAVALSSSAIDQSLREVQDTLDPSSGESDTLLAVGCDTEVGISGSIIQNALKCFEFAQEHRLPIQLATKFPLPQPLRECFEAWPPDQPRPVVFTTITTISISARIEPNAPRPAERAVNFDRHEGPWLSYALIKPFLEATSHDAEALIGLLSERRPDGAVVGARYRRRAAATESGSEHPFAKGWIGQTPSMDARKLINRLRSINLPVFMNTRCVSAWHNSSRHGQYIKREYPYLCVGCGACP